MSLTLFGFLNSLPELKDRVYLDVAPTTPATPYAIVYDLPGGVDEAYYGQADAVGVYPCVTVYQRPTGTQTPASARVALMALMAKISDAPHNVDTHSDGVTPFLVGSFSRGPEYPPAPDKAVQGQSFATAKFRAVYYRS